MATTQNTYTGNGSTTNYSFTFEYLKQSDVKITLDSVATTAFTFANATTIAFTSAPANGVAIRIFRDTAIDLLSATFFPGSAIKAEDLNQNFTQSLYVTQESDANAELANTTSAAAKTSADTALATSTTALTTANTSITTANTANTNATTAIADSAAALSAANAASSAVSNAVLFTLIANVASIPASPSNDDFVEVSNSTGIESFSPLSGVPVGFVGSSGLTVRIRYDASATSWVYMSYFANDSEDRYLTKNLPVVTGDSTNGSGQITLNCEVNTHGVKVKGPPHSAAANYTLTLPNNTGTNGQVLTTDGTGVLSFSSASGGGGGISNVVEDTTPQLGGNLDVNSNDITGTGNINITGDVTATNLSGALPTSNLTGTVADNQLASTFLKNIVEDTSPQLGGTLDVNGQNISGTVRLNGLTYPSSDGTSSQVLQTNGSGVLSFATVSGSGGSDIPSGTTMLFYETSAPTGWTKSTSINNHTLRIVSGSGGVTGGNVDFVNVFKNWSNSATVDLSNLYTGYENAGGSVSVTVQGHTLTTSQIPSHSHSYTRVANNSAQDERGGGANGRFTFDQGTTSDNTGSTGGNSSHNHGASASFSPTQHRHTISGSPTASFTQDLRVRYADFIICTKN